MKRFSIQHPKTRRYQTEPLILDEMRAWDLLAPRYQFVEVRINDSLASGCATYSVGLEGTFNLTPGERVTLQKSTRWQRRTPQLIGTDGGGRV